MIHGLISIDNKSIILISSILIVLDIRSMILTYIVMINLIDGHINDQSIINIMLYLDTISISYETWIDIIDIILLSIDNKSIILISSILIVLDIRSMILMYIIMIDLIDNHIDNQSIINIMLYLNIISI